MTHTANSPANVSKSSDITKILMLVLHGYLVSLHKEFSYITSMTLYLVEYLLSLPF